VDGWGGGGGRESVEALERNYKSSLSIMSDFMLLLLTKSRL